MALTAQGTHRDGAKTALTITVGGRTLQLSHVVVAGLSDAQIEAAMAGLATTAGVVLPDVYVHINDDGSLALATGAEPAIWPEDEPEEGA